MNENRISGLDSSQNGSDAANKNYVDSEIGKLPKPETDVLKLNGSRAMTGDLDMNNHQVDRVKSIFMNDSSSRLNMGEGSIYNVGTPTLPGYVVNKGYVDGEIAKIPSVDTSRLLPLDGSRIMTGDLKMAGKNILNVRALSDHNEDDPLETRERDLYSVVNK